MPNKRKLNSICIVKTAISGTLWGGVGLLAGGGMGAFAGGLLGVVLVGGPSTIVGISSGTYCSGRKYRKGEYWYSLVGTVLPALTVAGVTALVSDKNKYNFDATLITVAFAPITSTAAYYIFSEELPDTTKTP